MEFEHKSVLLEECINGLNVQEDGVYVDGTLGGAGHSAEICKRLKNGKLIGIDRDLNAIAKAKQVLDQFVCKTHIVHSNFADIKTVLTTLGLKKVDGILLDLGVSSHQLDEPQRGFSYMHEAPLDMRMDTGLSLSAYDVVNEYGEDKLFEIIKNYGEERWAKRIAEFIAAERRLKPIETTFELVSVIKKAIPKGAREDGPHPAKRTFQAIRIEVNGELLILEQAVTDAADCLNPGGRLCIITFHSLEDRIVKNGFRSLQNPCICPIDFPKCMCGKEPVVKIITKKPILPSESELELNPRARSAKLRIAEKL